MNIFLLILIISTSLSLISIIYNKKFFLSLLLGLESILLNLLIFNFIITFTQETTPLNAFSIFILTLSAIEASTGIAIITLINRNFNESNIYSLNTLKN
uniref:NADH-ubiquinone oxidoreductase chain 4L n=1 Tax=Ophioplocus japonicus TaxID=35056 RepID=A0A513X076_9ECHI|nr:NADH dehydrogenase subunit 4L [Ophioplocus japonicus]QDH07336.1 NADH dehydrogenase subunit 4L [Ophioplocus japonicus]